MVIKKNWFDYFNVIILLIFSCSIILPIMIVLSQSLMSQESVMLHGYTLLPKEISLAAYKYLLMDSNFIYRGFGVSIFITLVGTLLCLFFTITYAYSLSKRYLAYKKVFTFIPFFTMLFGGGLVPSYILIQNLGLLNSLWALILPGLISPWNMFVMRNFFKEIPIELEESAIIDGADDITILLKIVLPLSKPVIATMSLFYSVGYWNSWFGAAIYLSDRNKWPLQLILRQMVILAEFLMQQGENAAHTLEQLMQQVPTEAIKCASIVIISLPIIMVYPFLQKYFVKGIMIGSIKG